MKCPKCKTDFPRGAKFCANCGFEPMNRSFIASAVISIVGWAFILMIEIIEERWIIVVPAALLVVIWGYQFAARFRLRRVAVPD